MRALFEREWQDIAAGLFPAPRALSDRARPSSCAGARFISATCPRSTRGATAAIDDELPTRRRQDDGLPRLLPAELPFPERRLADRPFGRDLRHPGRGAVHRRRRRHAPARAEADRRVAGRPQPARTARPRCRLRHRPAARLPARRLAGHAAHRHRSQRALSRRSAPPDRPHGAREARSKAQPKRCRSTTRASISSSPRS